MGHWAGRWRCLLALGLVTAGCGGEGESEPGTTPSPAETCDPGQVAHPAGGCCEPGTTALDDGSCQPAGIPAELCAEGFVADGDLGCEPILPAAPCGPGEMAVPGDESCREVMACGDGAWGAIPVEPTTEYVDGSYAGGDSDGSADKPWTTIQQGVDGAESGAIVAVAAGTYTEDVTVMHKSVRLWGRCPAMVEVVGAGVEFAAIDLYNQTPDAEVRGLAITGPGAGLGANNSLGVVIDSVWIHDTGNVGFYAQSFLGPASVTLSNALVEGSRGFGVYLIGAELTVDGVVVRGTAPTSPGSASEPGFGVFVGGDPQGLFQAFLTVTRSHLAQNTAVGVYAIGGSVTLAGTVIRDTELTAAGTDGRGVSAEAYDDTGAVSQVALSGCQLAGNHAEAVYLSGGTLTASATVVRDTRPDGQGLEGRGFNIQASPFIPVPATGHISQSLVDGNGDLGIFVAGAELTVESTVVRRTVPDVDQWYGRGINVRPHPTQPFRTILSLRASVITDNHDVGVFVAGADAFVERSLVQDTLVRPDGGFGDGMVVLSHTDGFAAAHLADSRLARGGRVGVANFGSTVTLERVHVDCNPIALNGEQEYPYGEANVALPFTYNDWAGNVCGCGADQVPCQVLSTGLLPPDPGS